MACSVVPATPSGRSNSVAVSSARWTITAPSTSRASGSFPTTSQILLAADDHAGFADIEDALRTELVEAVREYAREEGYHFMGPVTVDLRVDNSLKPGRFGITSQIKQGEAGPRPGTIVMPSGDRIELSDGRNLIGRLSDCRIVITDGNTSRHHAEIHRSGSGFVINDLGSTNGTFLNGERLTDRPPDQRRRHHHRRLDQPPFRGVLIHVRRSPPTTQHPCPTPSSTSSSSCSW